MKFQDFADFIVEYVIRLVFPVITIDENGVIPNVPNNRKIFWHIEVFFQILDNIEVILVYTNRKELKDQIAS